MERHAGAQITRLISFHKASAAIYLIVPEAAEYKQYIHHTHNPPTSKSSAKQHKISIRSTTNII